MDWIYTYIFIMRWACSCNKQIQRHCTDQIQGQRHYILSPNLHDLKWKKPLVYDSAYGGCLVGLAVSGCLATRGRGADMRGSCEGEGGGRLIVTLLTTQCQHSGHACEHFSVSVSWCPYSMSDNILSYSYVLSAAFFILLLGFLFVVGLTPMKPCFRYTHSGYMHCRSWLLLIYIGDWDGLESASSQAKSM